MPKIAMPLSPEREKWAKRFKPTSFSSGTPLEYNAASAIKYTKAVNDLINRMVKDYKYELSILYASEESKDYFAGDSFAMDEESIAKQSYKITSRLNRKWARIFQEDGSRIAELMLGGIDKASTASLSMSLKELSGGLTISAADVTKDVQEVVQASFNANVDLITSIQSQYSDQIKGAVDRSIMTGSGLSDLTNTIEDSLTDQAKLAKNRAKNIALDQTRKAYNSINKARMESYGITKFQWLHSGGGREPRKHHKSVWPDGLNKGIFSFDDLPIIDEKTGERGIPGQAINCKCRMKPVIEFKKGEQV